MDKMASTYESDFYTWTLETAQKLREGELPESNDRFALIEEIEDLGLRKYDSFGKPLSYLSSTQAEVGPPARETLAKLAGQHEDAQLRSAESLG